MPQSRPLTEAIRRTNAALAIEHDSNASLTGNYNRMAVNPKAGKLIGGAFTSYSVEETTTGN